MRRPSTICVLIATLTLIGCGPSVTKPASAGGLSAEVVAERAKLSPDDRALVEAQQWCVVSDDEYLGAMGPPLKLTINGQPVFVCCGGCRKKAESNPDKTLAKLEELKGKAKKETDARK